MSYNFKKINDLELVNAVPEGANVLIETDGATKRLPSTAINNGYTKEECDEKFLTLENLPESVTSWNDLEDKPFYEETKLVSETITWDGVTPGSVVLANGWIHKVSDAVLTDDEIKMCVVTDTHDDSGSFELSEQWDYMTENGMVTDDYVRLDYVLIFVRTPGVDIEGVTFPEAGIYLQKGEFHIKSIALPELTKTVIHRLSSKFMPEGYPYEAEELVDGPLTITWDGNTDGLTAVDEYDTQYIPTETSRGGWYKVSDLVPTDDEIDSMRWVTCYDGGIEVNYSTEAGPADCKNPDVTETYAKFGYILFVRVPYDNFSECGIYVKKEGVYGVDGSWSSETYISSITVPFILTKQPAMVVHPIDPKFMPEHNHSWNDLTDKPFGDIITRDPVMENVTVNCIDDGSYGRYEETYYDGDNRQFVLTAGEVYAVEWDGQTYTCQAVKGDYGAAIGNMSLYDGSGPAYGYGSMTENTGEPFAIFYQSYDSIFNHVVAKTEGEHTFTISTQTTETVRLDKKFLPDDVGGGGGAFVFQVLQSEENPEVYTMTASWLDIVSAYNAGKAVQAVVRAWDPEEVNAVMSICYQEYEAFQFGGIMVDRTGYVYGVNMRIRLDDVQSIKKFVIREGEPS